MDVTETNAESDESFEVIPFPETDDLNTEIFENPVIAVSINTESSIEQEGGNHGEKDTGVETKPFNISFVCLDYEPNPNSGNGSHTFTPDTYTSDIKYENNAKADSKSSDLKDENNDTTVDEANSSNQNTDQNSLVTINDPLPTHMVDINIGEKNTIPKSESVKQNKEKNLEQQKSQNVFLHEKENEPPTILPIELSADNKRIPVESTRRFEESNNLVIHCGQEDKPTKQKQDQNRMNIFKEQDSYDDALKSSIRNGNTIEGFQRNSEAINNEPKFESLGEHDVHHDDVEQNKAIERYQEASKFVEGNKSQKDHSEVEHKYKDMSLRDIQDTAATNQNEEIPQHKENNESKIEDTQNQFAQTAQVDRHVFETSRNSDMDKSDQSQPDDYGISSDTTGTSNLSDSVEIFPIQTLGINQGKSKQDETNIIMMLESYTSLSEENKCIVFSKMLQNASTSERAFISDKLQLESEEVVNNTTNYKPSNTYQVRDGEDHKDHVMDTDQKPNTDLNSFSEDNSQHESKSDVEDLLYDKTRPTITTESQLNENGHRFNISQNTSSVKSYTLQHELQEHPSEETNNLPIKAESQQDEDGNGMDIIENTQSPFVPDKLQYDPDEITSQTDQKPSHTFNTHNNGYCINEPGSKVEEKDKKDSFQQKIKDSEDDMLADVNNVDNLQQESEKAVESPSSNKTRPTIQAGAVDVFKHELQHDQQDENPQNTNIMQNEESSTETKLFVHEELQYDSDDMINSPTEQKPSQTFNTQNNECCTNVPGSGVMKKDVQDVFQQEIKDSEDDSFVDVSNDTQQNESDVNDPGSKVKEKDKKNVFQQEIKDSKDDLLADVSNVDNLQHESEKAVESPPSNKTRPTIQADAVDEFKHELQEDQQDDSGHSMNIISKDESSKKPIVSDELQYDSDEIINSTTEQKPSQNAQNNESDMNDSGSKVKEKDTEDAFQQEIKTSKEDSLPDISSEIHKRKYVIEKRFRLAEGDLLAEDICEELEIKEMYWMSYKVLMTSTETIPILKRDLEYLKVTVGIHQASENPCIYFPVFKDRKEMEECYTLVMRTLVQCVGKYIGRYIVQLDKGHDQDISTYIKGCEEVLNNNVAISLSHEDNGVISQLYLVGIRNVIPVVLFHAIHRFHEQGNLRLLDADGKFKVEINKVILQESHYEIFHLFDINSVFAQDYPKCIVQANGKEKSFYVLSPIGETMTARDALLSGKWLGQIPHDRCQMHPLFFTLLQHPEALHFINNKLEETQTGKYSWLRDTDDNVVIYAESSALVSSVMQTIRSSLIIETISVQNADCIANYIQSGYWQDRIEMICSRHRGKIIVHTGYRTSGMIDITTVGTNDLLLAIAGFSTESKSLLADLSREQSMSVKTILSKTVEMDPYQFKYLCSLMNITLLDAGSSHNFEIMKVDNGKQRGFVVSGNDSEIVSQISNEISENAKHIKRKVHLLRQRVAILTLQKNHVDLFSSMGTRYNCLVSVDTTKNAELPTLRVESDYVATRGRWFMENGCEICLTLKEPELCQVDVLVEQREQEGIQDDAVRFSPDLGLLNQVIIKIALSWNGGRNGEKDKLHKLLENVFLSATSLTHRSLAFGVQNFCGWPYKTFCKCLIFSLKQVSSDAIDKVYFCCQDENVCQNIKGILRDAAIKEFHAPSEKIGISVIEGELAKQKVDVIVNTTGRQLDLSNGAVSKSISNCAGNGMQQEIKNKYPNGIDFGDVAITGCHKLGCKTVLHCALYAWAVNGEEQKKCTQALQMCITKCLAEVDKQKHKTIAFPVLGAGNLSVPVKTAAGCMIDGIKAYGVSNPKTSITTVKIIVYKDKQILKTFNEMLEHKGRNKSEPKTTTNPDKCVVADLPAYKSPMTIEIIGPEDSIKNVVAEIEKFEKCPRQSLAQHWTAIKVEKTVPSTTATSVPTTNPNSDNRSPVCRTKNDHGKQFIEKFQRLNLVRTEDVQCCLVAVKLPEGDDVKSIIEHELKSKQCQHYHVLYPYESSRQALITCRCREDAEYTITQSFDTFQVEELPAQILCNIEAEIRPDFFTLIPSKIEKSVLKKRLIEKSGVTISAVNERETWNLRGLQVQIETALDFLQEYLDSTKGQFQDLNSTVDFCTKATDMSSVKDTTATCTSAKDNQPIALHNYQASATSYTDKKHSDVKEHAKATIAVREIESVSLEEYLAFQTFFPDISHLFAKENETMEYKAETRTISVVCERQNIDNVFEAVKQRVLTLKSYSKEIVPYQQSDDLKLTSVHGDICKTFPGLFCSISDENREICLIGQNPKEVRDAKCHFELLLGNAVDRPVVSNNACQAAIPTCGDLKNSNVFNTANGLYVRVYQANILNLPVQCIVNAANRKLEHGGGVADVISKASGGVIEKESKGFIGTYGELNVGTACYTRAGTLKYEYVIHTVGPRWSDYKTKQESERQRCASDLQRAIQSAIKIADQLGMTSVGIPPVSAGTYGVPKDICAKSYASGVIEASKLMTLKSTLKEIHFIDKDLEMVQLITKVFRDFFAEHNPISNNDQSSLAEGGRKWSKPLNKGESSLSSQERRTHLFYPVHKEDKSTGVLIHEFQLSEKLKVCVYTKALETATVQALVCGQDIHFQNKGAVAEGIRKVAGNTYGRRVEEARKQKPQFNIGEVVCLPGGEWLTYVLHAVTPKWKKKGNHKQSFSKGVSKCYANVLKEAAELGIHTIAVPLLGAGSEGCSSKKIAEILLDEILLFVYEANPRCFINEIHIVNKSPDVTKVVVALFDEHVSSEWRRLDAEGRT